MIFERGIRIACAPPTQASDQTSKKNHSTAEARTAQLAPACSGVKSVTCTSPDILTHPCCGHSPAERLCGGASKKLLSVTVTWGPGQSPRFSKQGQVSPHLTCTQTPRAGALSEPSTQTLECRLSSGSPPLRPWKAALAPAAAPPCHLRAPSLVAQ